MTTQHSPAAASLRLAALRRELERRNLTGFVVPRADQHQGEYVPPSAQRLGWLTGFTGSAGAAVVLADKAAVFVDGRYTLQVLSEVDTTLFAPLHLTEHPPQRWLGEVLDQGHRLGFDPWLHTPDQVQILTNACERVGAVLVPCPDNPLDAVWTDRPAPPASPVTAHPEAFAGRSAAGKRGDIAAELARERLDAAVLSAPESVAWLLNIRADDVAFTPLPLAFAILHADSSVELFLEPGRIAPQVAAGWGDGVRAAAPARFEAALRRLGRDGKRVRLDSSSAPFQVWETLRAAGARVEGGADPCALPRACKNPVEMAGTRTAHHRDGAAMVRFLAWLDRATRSGSVDEMGAADALEGFRRPGEHFRGLSFPTISGAGANGAIVHYHSTPKTNRPLAAGELYLVDSGAQYLDGTTDITRTVLVGDAAPDEARRRFTLVLRGHIALARAVFPAGTTGSQLDVLARRPLWAAGLDYDHGTGHGVGSFLSVHEGPQRISKVGNSVALRPGMILSNEPGYYKTGAYGIRIENLVLVTPQPAPAGAERDLLGFETLTLAPIDRALVAVELLEAGEREWLNAYHAQVRDEIGPLLEDAAERDWLERATAAL
ncbi:Xaa-Pro aminopeptidase [Paramagnetospirillum caucaseum]|uniref:Xaa-Pro aminopeptidase n=1 Tax=Paramagnetospirillum caucaseum TaxID=1244869 RepID=M3AF67_9PROT|nr:aminopeptidase P family protein [Paramagnetospirillum caucaseum]EME71498.1 Xaa-Pro aminopeptidase [Paramagnetospirillum caucaseum]